MTAAGHCACGKNPRQSTHMWPPSMWAGAARARISRL
nr:MAG TPA: hypothetical protein [Caudoviricetes sp.]